MSENRIDKEDNLLIEDDHFIDFSGEEEENEGNDKDNFLENVYLEEKKILISMGFKEDLISKIYKNIHPVNLQEALDYLNKNEKDKFIHSFIPNDRNVCLICEEKQNAHAGEISKDEDDDIIPITDRVYRDSLDKYREKKEPKKALAYYNIYKTECGICGDEINNYDKQKINQPCKHNFCIDCWFEYLKEKINNANVYKISCMNHECNYSLTEHFVKSIIGQDNQLLQKYDKFLTRKKLMESNKKIKKKK